MLIVAYWCHRGNSEMMEFKQATPRRYDEGRKRPEAMTLEDIQSGNVGWWTGNPMSYDWHGEINAERYSRAWFDAIDAKFIHGARLFAHGSYPFERVIPFEQLAGKHVLEIGCGMGLHTELMLRAGANVLSVDLTESAITATSKRLALKGLQGDIRRADAEKLPFESEAFDFIWSWGVIHHSARTGRIVREIYRVARPTAEVRLMVYNRSGTPAALTFLVRYLLGLGFLSRSFDDELNRATDGFMARYYTRDQFEDLLRVFFDDVSSQICGQDADVLPLPRIIRRPMLKVLSEGYLKRAQAKRGGLIFATACRKNSYA
jgi:2-polyprenyl-3-methyl-5-hydroxy-6-metoxy-1,4-benzoquinol methylase